MNTQQLTTSMSSDQRTELNRLMISIIEINGFRDKRAVREELEDTIKDVPFLIALDRLREMLISYPP